MAAEGGTGATRGLEGLSLSHTWKLAQLGNLAETTVGPIQECHEDVTQVINALNNAWHIRNTA